MKTGKISILDFFNGLLMIDEDICHAYLSTINERAVAIEAAARTVPRVNANKGVAVINVNGVLSYRPEPMLAWLFGDTGIEDIRGAFRSALADNSIGTIVFDINSPGGEVSGIFDLADDIFNARGTKPIYAVANEMAYSAAYAIASAADKVYVPRSGGVGSIGVLAVHVDKSKMEEMQGLVYSMVYAGDKKLDLSNHAPLSKEAKGALQSDVDDMYSLFVDTVARNRGLKASEVRGQQAGKFRGKKSIEAGLADSVMSFNQVINKIVGSGTTTLKGGNRMETIVEQIKALFTASPEIKMADVFGQLGFIPQLADGMVAIQASERDTMLSAIAGIDGKVKTEVETQAEKDKKYAMDVVDICSLAGLAGMVGGFIKAGTPIDDVKTKVLAEKGRTGTQQIRSTVGGTSTGEENELIADAKAKAGIK